MCCRPRSFGQRLLSFSRAMWCATSLPGVELKAEVTDVDGGTRVTLQIAWDAFGRRENPLRLTAWHHPSAGGEDEEDLAPTAPDAPAEDQAARRPVYAGEVIPR